MLRINVTEWPASHAIEQANMSTAEGKNRSCQCELIKTAINRTAMFQKAIPTFLLTSMENSCHTATNAHQRKRNRHTIAAKAVKRCSRIGGEFLHNIVLTLM